MPELPEAETLARALRRRVLGRRILGVWLGHAGILRSPPERVTSGLRSSYILRVRRWGKNLLFGIAADRHGPVERWLQVCLGMSGHLLLAGGSRLRPRHTHAVLVLQGGRELRYVDPRRFGRLALFSCSEWRKEIARFGPDPLELSAGKFVELLSKHRAMVKAVLLNQRLLRGLGNIYVDESLFRARLHPRRRTDQIPQRDKVKLYRAMGRVLSEAIRYRGSSISDYVDLSGRDGDFQKRHRVYGRAGRPCVRCRIPIVRRVVAGRSSSWCPRCQRLPVSLRIFPERKRRGIGP